MSTIGGNGGRLEREIVKNCLMFISTTATICTPPLKFEFYLIFHTKTLGESGIHFLPDAPQSVFPPSSEDSGLPTNPHNSRSKIE